jgi:hypothetical protein
VLAVGGLFILGCGQPGAGSREAVQPAAPTATVPERAGEPTVASGPRAAFGPQPAAALPDTLGLAADPSISQPVPPGLSAEKTLADWPRPQVALVLTGQQLGYIEPCGCSGLENQKGGLARRQTLIDHLARERGWTVVPLDVGNQVRRSGKQQEVKFAHVVQGLRQMGYPALTLGDADLRLTPAALLAALAGPEGTIPDVVGSNVAILARELMPRWRVIEAGGKRIGVTGVLGRKFQQALRGDELVHEPPEEGLARAASELAAQRPDLTILLAQTSREEARELARRFPQFDLVVASGDSPLMSAEPELIEGTSTRLIQVGRKAMYVAVLGWYDDPRQPLRYASVPLDARWSDSAAMLQLLADYQEQLKELGLDGLGLRPLPHPSGRQFVGSQTCGECHSKAYAIWSQTPHAHATESLVHPPNSRGQIARHFDPECLSCHVTGWNPQQYYPYASGYLSLEATPHLVASGCENCHGPGSAHVAAENGEGNPAEELVLKLRREMRLPLADGVAERRCLECHDEDNSPDFHRAGAFEAYWKKVEHWGKD